MSLIEQSIFVFILKISSVFLNLMVLVSKSSGHVPQRLFWHLVTLKLSTSLMGFAWFAINFALVSICLRFLGCRLLLISLYFARAFFIFGLASSNEMVSFIILNMSGFLGLCVETNASGSLALCFSFGWRSSSRGMFFAFSILFSISDFGYPCFNKTIFKLPSLSSLDLFSSTIVQVRLARLKGMFRLVWGGWHLVSEKHRIYDPE